MVSQTDTNRWAKAGVMIRETLTAGSTQALVAVTPSEGGLSASREQEGSSVTTEGPLTAAPYWVRLVRAGDTFTAYASADGSSWSQIGQDSISMASSVYIGLAVSSHYQGVLSTATFDDVTVGSAISCNPLSFGAVGDGKTDNTSAIQNAVDACAAQGGGVVELSVDGGSVTGCELTEHAAPLAARILPVRRSLRPIALRIPTGSIWSARATLP